MLDLWRAGREIKSLAEEFDVPEQSLGRYLRSMGKEAAGQDSPGRARIDRGGRDDDGRVNRRPARPDAPTADLPSTVAETFEAAFGMEPMRHQLDYFDLADVDGGGDLVCLKARQVGMSFAAAALAIHTARSSPGPDVVVASPTQRQSSEVGFKIRTGLWTLGERLDQDSATVLRLENGSRVVLLSGSERGARGFSARLVIVDEAALVPDDVWEALHPVTAATHGRVVVQSTPRYQSGFFYQLWSEPADWRRLHIPADGILDPAYLARQRARMPALKFQQEYGADFAGVATAGAWFTEQGYQERVNPAFPALVIDLDSLKRE
jgi:hypothetical protein